MHFGEGSCWSNMIFLTISTPVLMVGVTLVQEVKGGLDERRQHPAKLAFQGIRNFINQET